MSEETSVIGWLNDIKDAKGKAKQEWLVKFRDNAGATEVSLLKNFLYRCYEPTITYGVTSADIVIPRSSKGTKKYEDLCFLLNDLAERKLTGSAAQSAIKKFRDDAPVWLVVAMVRILDRDAKCGIGISTINKVWPGMISTFDVMLAAQFDEDKLTFPCFIEPKFDGMRMIAIQRVAGGWDFFTRSGKTIDTVSSEVRADLTHLATAIRSAGSIELDIRLMFDGELMGESFRETMSQARKKDSTFESANYHVFDWLPARHFFALEEDYKSGQNYKTRRATLAKAFSVVKHQLNGRVKLPTSYLVASLGELHRFYQTLRDAGYEGLIAKRTTGLYRPSRHHDWIKMKAEETLDLPIVGIERGTGKYENTTGALIVDHKGVHVNVGTGLTDEDREIFWRMWQMDNDSMRGLLIEVSFQEITPDGSLRHPRFVRIRSDKTIPESAWS